MSRELTEKKRRNISRFKGCLRADRYKQPSSRLQTPYRANTQAVLTEVGIERVLL